MASQRWVDLVVKEEITRSALRCRRLKRTLLQIFSASASYKVMRQLGGLHNPVPQFRADSATGRYRGIPKMEVLPDYWFRPLSELDEQIRKIRRVTGCV